MKFRTGEMSIKQILLLVTTLVLSTGTNAALITYELNNVSFDDGGSATGWFIYDTEAVSISGINITTSTIASYGLHTYDDADIIQGDNKVLALFNTTDIGYQHYIERTLILGFDTSLSTTLSSIIQTDGSGERLEEHWEGSIVFGHVRFIVSGSVEPVPVPAALWLFVSGLMGLIGIARRKKS
jgi:hypothetical protein